MRLPEAEGHGALVSVRFYHIYIQVVSLSSKNETVQILN